MTPTLDDVAAAEAFEVALRGRVLMTNRKMVVEELAIAFADHRITPNEDIMTPADHRITPNEDIMTPADHRIAELEAEIARLESNDATIRHWAFGHIDALLLYADEYTGDSHVEDAVAFCRLIDPKRKLRMNHLRGHAYHPARYMLEPKT